MKSLVVRSLVGDTVGGILIIYNASAQLVDLCFLVIVRLFPLPRDGFMVSR